MADGDSFDRQLETADDEPAARETAPSLNEIWDRRIGRRGLLKGMRNAALLAGVASAPLALAACDDTDEPQKAAEPEKPNPTRFKFAEIEHGVDETHHVARGYRAEPILRWGDPILKGAPDFDPMEQTAAAQRLQFGYNNDYVGFVPLPYGTDASDRGLLCVNHEFTSDPVMLPGIAGKDPRKVLTREQVDVTMAAHGGSIVEIRRDRTAISTAASRRSIRRSRSPAPPRIIRACAPAKTRSAAPSSARSTIAPAVSRPGAPTSWPKRM